MWEEKWREELGKFRRRINNIDSKIIKLIGSRMKACKGVGEIKAQRNLPVYVPEREIQVIKTRQEIARRYGIAASFISKLFQLVMSESKRLQHKTN